MIPDKRITDLETLLEQVLELFEITPTSTTYLGTDLPPDQETEFWLSAQATLWEGEAYGGEEPYDTEEEV